MRTTLTIEDDVAALLASVQRTRNATLKAVVNEALRVGLHELSVNGREPRKLFRTEPLGGGKPLLPNVDNIAEVLAFAEGEAFR